MWTLEITDEARDGWLPGRVVQGPATEHSLTTLDRAHRTWPSAGREPESPDRVIDRPVGGSGSLFLRVTPSALVQELQGLEWGGLNPSESVKETMHHRYNGWRRDRLDSPPPAGSTTAWRVPVSMTASAPAARGDRS